VAGLPKNIIKKYGVSKKAWAVYRAQKRKPSRSTKRTRKSRKRRYTTKTKRKKYGGKKSMFNFGGGLGKGIAVGVATGVIGRFIPVNIAGADYIIAGMLMKDSTVQKLGAITLGRSLAGSLTGMVTGQGNGGGY
jgi:hypothetical protein